MRPEWVIYKNEQRLGQSVTWHGALDVLMRAEGLTTVEIDKYAQLVLVNRGSRDFNYKIVKER